MATFDLRTGASHAPDPNDYITKVTACRVARPGTPHPLWTAFLDRVTDHNPELQGFLKRYIGYCCSGEISEHVFVFAYGTGANGKSTFINTIAAIFGDYATVADMSTFIASHSEHHPTDLAKLNGARLVVAQETQKGRRWDETKIKAFTGGDKITARFMRQDFFDFTPTFKLFICGNHKPRLLQRAIRLLESLVRTAQHESRQRNYLLHRTKRQRLHQDAAHQRATRVRQARPQGRSLRLTGSDTFPYIRRSRARARNGGLRKTCHYLSEPNRQPGFGRTLYGSD